MLLALASTVNSLPLHRSVIGRCKVAAQEHCLTGVNWALVPNPPPEDFDDFEEVRETNAKTGESQSTAQSNTQGSTLFDTNTGRTTTADEDTIMTKRSGRR